MRYVKIKGAVGAAERSKNMPVTVELFLWVQGVIIAILLGFFGFVWRLHSDIAPISSLAKHIQAEAIDIWLRERGLIGSSTGQKRKANANHHSLPPEKIAQRDALIALGRERWLTESEAARLRDLLQEDARDDFARGLISALALAVLMITIGAIISSLSQQR